MASEVRRTAIFIGYIVFEILFLFLFLSKRAPGGEEEEKVSRFLRRSLRLLGRRCCFVMFLSRTQRDNSTSVESVRAMKDPIQCSNGTLSTSINTRRNCVGFRRGTEL